jgi:hypothetical protein
MNIEKLGVVGVGRHEIDGAGPHLADAAAWNVVTR